MSKQKCDFHTMNVTELKKYLQERGVSVSGYLKSSLIEIASAVEAMMLQVDPIFERDKTNDADSLLIHDMQIPNPFSLKTMNNFNNSLPPFGLYDIFNHLIYHSTEYDKQGLAAYKSFDVVGVTKYGDGFALKSTSQLEMFVTGLKLCNFAVWTKQGILSVEVLFDPKFMFNVCAKLEKFWTSQVLPFLMTAVSRPVLSGIYLLYHNLLSHLSIYQMFWCRDSEVRPHVKACWNCVGEKGACSSYIYSC